jgi:carnitine O-acetyltransferase
MVIQLANQKMFGASRPNYESAQTRKFQGGRTETSHTTSTWQFYVKDMEDATLPAAQKIAAVRAVLKSQGVTWLIASMLWY